MTRITFENVTISLTAPNGRAAYDALVALFTTPAAYDAEVAFCTDRYVAQETLTRTVEGPTSDLWELQTPDDDREARATWESASAQTQRDLTGQPDLPF